MRMSDEYADEITRNRIYPDNPRGHRNVLTKTRELSPWYCRGNAAPRFRGKVVEPRVDFRRVAPSRLPEASEAYK